MRDQELIEEVAEHGHAFSHALNQSEANLVARAVIPLIQKRLLEEMIKPTNELNLARILRPNIEAFGCDEFIIWKTLLRAFAKSKGIELTTEGNPDGKEPRDE